MSKVALSGNASGTGTFTIASPNSNTDRTINLPDSNGTILTTATPGVPVNGPAFSAFRSGSQAITALTWTKLQINSEEFDTNNCFDNTTNYRFTPTVAGYYQVTGVMETSGAPTYQYINIYKNGGEFKRASVGASPGTSVLVTALIYCNGSTDYLELYVQSSSSVNAQSGLSVTYFQAAMIRSAT